MDTLEKSGTHPIPFYSFTEIHRGLEGDFVEEFAKLIKTSKFVFDTEEFEQAFAEYVGARYASGVSNGTAALHLALLAVGVEPGDEVITVAHSFRATAAAVHYCGARPVYIDIEPTSLCMDPSRVLGAITDRTRAIIVVHLYGNLAEVEVIKEIADRSSLPLIEDCSQAHGTRLNGRHCGTFGDIGTFSFYPGKTLGAFGDAGCVVTNSLEYHEKILDMRSWSDSGVGMNYRMASLQAKILKIKLKHLDGVLQEKKKVSEKYREAFGGQLIREGVFHSNHIYALMVRHRKKLLDSISRYVELKVHYPVPIYRLSGYLTSDCLELPVTNEVANSQLSLPIYPGVDSESVIYYVHEALTRSGAELITDGNIRNYR